MNSFKIGKVTIRNKGVLAPMLEFTTLPFRLLCKKYGCGLTYTEMIHTFHIKKIDINEIESLSSCEKDNPTSVQLVGDFTNKQLTIDAAHILDKHKHFNIIALNLGCPSKKIISGNSGSALLKDISKITPVIKEIKETCKKPITTKVRLGYLKNEINYISKQLEKTGIDAIAIHARTANQNYGAPADVDSVRKIKEQLNMPVIYNGDVNQHNFQDLLDFDGLMVGRNALGNPLIFKQIKENNIFEINYNQKLDALKEFLDLCNLHPIPFGKLKVSVLPFISGFPQSSVLRNKISMSKTEVELKEILNKLLEQ